MKYVSFWCEIAVTNVYQINLAVKRDFTLHTVHTILSTHLPPVKQEPLAAPNVEQATAKGMTTATLPRTRSPQVCEETKKTVTLQQHYVTSQS